jgi:ribonuclease P protein component
METLRKRPDFLKAAKARRVPASGFLLQARRRAPEGDPAPDRLRVGFTCSKKVGNAVARNRAKRRLRALAREVLPHHGHVGWDYVLIGRAGATAERDFAKMRDELIQAVQQVHRPRRKPGSGEAKR